MSKLPPSASVTNKGEGGKLCAPAAARNAAALCDLLLSNAPRSGTALEIASGTGQHVAAFAAALPGLQWHPTDIAPDRLASIDAHAAEAGVRNIVRAKRLDATAPNWSQSVPPHDLIVLVNLLHLIPNGAARTLITEAAQALTHGGRLILYGPFKRKGRLTSDGDARFDADLRAANPEIGYKDDAWVKEKLVQARLHVTLIQNMPANNLAFIADRTT